MKETRQIVTGAVLSAFFILLGVCQAEDLGKVANQPASSRIFNVCDHGAKGDGVTLDTAAVHQAVEACAKAGGGQVLIPPGRYVSGTIHMRSHVTLFLAAGATLIGTTNLSEYQPPSAPSFMPQAKYGNWHRGLIVAENAEDMTICGQGTIDGHKVFDAKGEEHMRGPHTITFAGCRKFTIRDVSIVDSANYAIFVQVSDDVDVRNVKITGGWDGVHFRGTPDHWCHNVNLFNCQFYTGDDSVAGSYWDSAVISGCTLNSSCNGIRLIGPARHLIVNNCLFYGPGLQPHRTSNRTNSLSGIILQPGAWDRTEGMLDDVLIANNTMRDVSSPVTIWTKPGNRVGSITISGLEATGVYRSAISAESWSNAPISKVVLRNAHIEFAGGGQAELAKQPVQAPHVDVRPLPAWAVYARNVQHFILEDVRFSLAKDDARPVILADNVTRLSLDTVRFCRVPGVTKPIATINVGKLELRQTDLLEEGRLEPK
jgi:polygalacturonase